MLTKDETLAVQNLIRFARHEARKAAKQAIDLDAATKVIQRVLDVAAPTPKGEPRHLVGVTDAELAAILAGLRAWQHLIQHGAPPPMSDLMNIAVGRSEDGLFLVETDIDKLCEELNF